MIYSVFDILILFGINRREFMLWVEDGLNTECAKSGYTTIKETVLIDYIRKHKNKLGRLRHNDLIQYINDERSRLLKLVEVAEC